MTSGVQVTTDTYSNGTVRGGMGRRSFTANGRRWVFYLENGRYVAYQSSADGGATWSSQATIVQLHSSVPEYKFAVAVYPSTNRVHLAYCNTSGYLCYRTGVCGSNGAITWDGAAVTVDATATCTRLSVCVDSGGHAVIGYVKGSSLSPYVAWSTTTSTTWTNGSGSPTRLSTTTDSTWYVQVAALSSGNQWYVAYSKTDTVVYGRLFNSTLGSQESATPNGSPYGYNWDMCVVNGTDPFVIYQYNAVAPTFLVYNRRTSGSWGTAAQLGSSTSVPTNTFSPILLADGVNIYVMGIAWSTANSVGYYKYDGSAWTLYDAVLTETLISSDVYFNADITAGDHIGVYYITSSASPYAITYGNISFATSVVKDVTDVVGVSDSLLRNRTVATLIENVGVVDGVVRGRVLPALIESVGVSDSMVRNRTMAALVENVRVADLISDLDIIGATATKVYNEVVEVCDGLEIFIYTQAPVSKIYTEAVGVGDSARRISRTARYQEGVAAADSATKTRRMAAIVENVVAVDTARFVQRTLRLSEAVGVADSAPWKARMLSPVTDSVGVTDALRFPRLVVHYADAGGVADVVGPKTRRLAPLAENVGTVDRLALVGWRVRVADTVSAADAISRRTILIPSTVSVSDVQRFARRYAHFVQPVSVSESAYAGRTAAVKSYSEAVGVCDGIEIFITSGILYLTYTDTVGTTDAVSKVRIMPALADAVGVTDRAAFKAWYVHYADAAGVQDRIAGKSMLLPSSVHVADAFHFPRWFTHVADAVGAVDAATAMRSGLMVVFADIVGTADSARIGKTLRLASMVGVADAALATRSGVVLVFADAVGTVDAVGRNKRMMLADAVATADLVRRSKTFALVQTVAVTDGGRWHKTLMLASTVATADALRRDKAFSLAQPVGIADAMLRHRTMALADALAVAERLLLQGRVVHGSEALVVMDAATARRTVALRLYSEAVGVSDRALRNKVLRLVEVVVIQDGVVRELFAALELYGEVRSLADLLGEACLGAEVEGLVDAVRALLAEAAKERPLDGEVRDSVDLTDTGKVK